MLVTVTAQAKESIPTEFSTDIWTSFNHDYHVEFHNQHIVYAEVIPNHDPKPIEISPSIEQWRVFRATLEQLGVWQWHSYYEWRPPEVFDGSKWSLRLDYQDSERVSTGGDNRYPGRGGAPSESGSPSPTFRAFEGAVEKLLGGHRFRVP